MKFLLSLLLLFAFNSSAAFAQAVSSPDKPEKVDPFIREHSKKRAKNPAGVLFTVRLKDDRKQFHLGEIISLELSFAASKPAIFTLDAATYDRSGRLHSDGFIFDQRDGVVDPLRDYFQSGLSPFIGGGLRSIPDLTDKPYIMTIELNEWQRFDKPGHFRMYVVSNRVQVKSGNRGDSTVVSNVIEFDVRPEDKKWAEQKLAEVVAALSNPEHLDACTTLRFLATPAAVPEMRKRFNGEDKKCEWEYKFGLIGSPHRDLVIRQMEDALGSREQPVTTHYLSTLTLLEFTKRAAVVAPYPDGNLDQDSFETQMERRSNIYNELHLHYLRQLMLAIPQKQGVARATSLQALLDNGSALSVSDGSQWSTLIASMPEVFNRLPLIEQLRALKYHWRPLASAAMLPALREILKYSYEGLSKEQKDEFNVTQQWELRSIAMRRLHELSPEEGRQRILEEVRSPKPRVLEEVLLSLADEVLPELDTALLGNLEESFRNGSGYDDIHSELIERYATEKILSQVQAVYEARTPVKWRCRTQAALLAYFLRVAPSAGADYVKKALAARDEGPSSCYEEVLKNVADLHMSAELEEIATAALNDEDSDVVSLAAGVLGAHGSADAEKALWRRLEKSHANRSQKVTSNQQKIENALREALTRGQAWLSDPEKLRRVRELCRTDKSRDEIDQMISGWNPLIYIELNRFDEKPTITLAQYQTESLNLLKAKLLQFPKDTIFKLKTRTVRGDEARAEKLFEQIKLYLDEHGMKLTRETAQ